MSMFFQSLIDVDRWNKAKWLGTAYLVADDAQTPPCLGLVFKDVNAGTQIFKDLIQRLGKEDSYEELRIAIIEGDIPEEEPGYSVHISSDPSQTVARAKAQGQDIDFDKIMVVSRVHRMNPDPKSPFLANFKLAFSKHMKYLLIPVFASGPSSSTYAPQFDLAIGKKQIYFRNTKDVGPNDRDSVIFAK